MYHTELFRPALYSSSAVLPSLGDLLLNTLLLFILSLVFYYKGKLPAKDNDNSTFRRYALNGSVLFFMLILFMAAGSMIASLVENSSVSLNLQNISGLTPYSAVGLLIIGLLLFSVWFVSVRCLDFVVPRSGSVTPAIISLLAVIALFVAVAWWTGIGNRPTVLVFYTCVILAGGNIKWKGSNLFSVQSIIFFLCLFSLFTTVLLHKANDQRERDRLDLVSGKLVLQRNPVTEVLYEQTERKLRADTMLRRMISGETAFPEVAPDSLARYLREKYFRDYWKRYQLQVTVCTPGKVLKIQPQGYLAECSSYFAGVISGYGRETAHPNLKFLDYGPGKEYYLAIFPGSEPGEKKNKVTLYLEFNLLSANPDPGYPGLLMEKSRQDLPDPGVYSYAIYQNGELVRSVGEMGYRSLLKEYPGYHSAGADFTEDKTIHRRYRINDRISLLISRQKVSFLTLAAPFSYIFILLSLMALVLGLILRFQAVGTRSLVTLRNRLHFALIGILVVTLIAVGISQVINIVQINQKKNEDSLRERTLSVIAEVQHRYSREVRMTDIPSNELEDFLVKLSNVFFTDINVYNSYGRLVSTSRRQIFEEGLLSERMNPAAFERLSGGQTALYIQREAIGKMQFNSAYLPFYNDQDQLLGFVNLPYFARQDEAKREISSFLVTFLNVYILLILFGVFVTVLISNYITAPLALLARKMSQLQLGHTNEKITWKQEDEIGRLVGEYNRMIDELERSAEMLARSERESAWRGMARQVAHEIKNPLTPMKLSTQYLLKAWKENAGEWETRLERYTRTMVEQIDALSVIASDFSEFARMETLVMTRLDLDEIVGFVISLYENTTPARFEYIREVPVAPVRGDRTQVIRMFTNLITNAIHAIGDRQDGRIVIRSSREDDWIVIAITDNGCGIPLERTGKIFQPDFTTKTSGMGLGLAIVKGITEGMGGVISVTSEEEKGTTFTLKFPWNE